jgi:tRNA nucleotidyltransferase (CCA-adding enzyme)
VVAPLQSVEIICNAPDDELLFAEWLNAVVYEMDVRKMLFRRYAVDINGNKLHAVAWGEPADFAKHHPAVEVKGATYTTLRVARDPSGEWMAQTVVDV